MRNNTTKLHISTSGILVKIILFLNRALKVSMVIGHGLGGLGFDLRQEQGCLSSSPSSRPFVGPTKPRIQRAPDALSSGNKASGT
jgi:hypothetical protein